MKSTCNYLAVLVLVALGSAACTEGARRSPTAPTSAGQATAVADGSGVTIDKTTNVVRDVEVITDWATQHGWQTLSEGFEVEGTDVVTAVTGTCPNVVMTIRGVPVTVNGSTTFGTGGSCAGITVSRTAHVRGLLTYTQAGGFVVTATSITFSDVNEIVTVEGIVTGVTGTCPAVTVALQSGSGVVATATTTFTPTASCTNIVAGARVRATGNRSATGTGPITATALEVLTVPATHTGRVTAISGTCPALTLSFDGGVTATATGTTTFSPAASCGIIVVGSTVSVTGTRAGTNTGAITATQVQVTGTPLEGETRVSTVTGTCPNLTMALEAGVTAITSSTTTFSPACSNIAAGSRVHVRGYQNSLGQFVLSEVRLLTEVRRRVGGEATVQAISGTCPAVSMTVAGVRVTTNSSTEFLNGACSTIRVSTKVHVEGYQESDGSVTATSVRITEQLGNGGGNGGQRVAGEGKVDEVTGSCSTSATFKVRNYNVVTTSTTAFTGGVCGDVRSGTTIAASGTISGHTLTAETVRIVSQGR